MRNIEHGVDITFKNNTYITSITFEFTVGRDNKQVNIFDRHKKISEAKKLVNNSTKMITTTGNVFEHPKRIPLGQEYVSHFQFMNIIQKKAQGLRLLQNRTEVKSRKVQIWRQKHHAYLDRK